MTGIDIVFIIVLVFATIRAVLRGFVREVVSLSALIGGLICAVFFSRWLGDVIKQWIASPIWRQIVAFLLIFVTVYLILKICENVLRQIIERIHLEGLDRALGLLLGIVEGLAVIIILLLLIQIQPVIAPERLLRDSWFAQRLLPFIPLLGDLLDGRSIGV